MTIQEKLNQLRTDPGLLINMIVNNNPKAVAQNAIAAGLFTYEAQPQELVQAINELINQGNIQTVLSIINVPFVKSGNQSDLYEDALQAVKSTAKTADGSSEGGLNWLNIGLSAVTGALTSLVTQTSTSQAPSANSPAEDKPGTKPKSTEKSNTLLYVGLGFFGLVVVAVVIYVVVKASGK